MDIRHTKASYRAGRRLKFLFQPAIAAFAICCLAFLSFPLIAVDHAAAAGGDVALWEKLSPGPSGPVEEVLGPALLRVGGLEQPVRLAALWDGDGRDKVTAAVDASALAYLRGRTERREVRLHLDRQSRNRFGEWLAQVEVSGRGEEQGFWLQGALLAGGYARVYTTAGTDALAQEMLALEAAARRQGRGLWQLPARAIRSAASLDRDIGSFQIVEGTVLAVAVTGSRVYLNFGEDWRRDFTVAIRRVHAGRFPGRLRGLRALAGERLRVRGWVFGLNGPAISADHAGVVEVLGK